MPGVNEEVRAEYQRGFRLVKELNEDVRERQDLHV